MAFWNAPLEDENHALNSCRSALTMMRDVQEFNDAEEAKTEAEKEHYHRIDVGVGINTGDCVVGNMGSELRFDYTALGDAVNLASRLEGQSKTYGLSIILGDATAKAVADQLATIEIDRIRVKGKNEPVHIHALFGDEKLFETEDFMAFRALNASMLASFRGQRWVPALHALDLMDGLAEKLGFNISDYIFIYDNRINEFRANPPGSAWDGVYDATSK